MDTVVPLWSKKGSLSFLRSSTSADLDGNGGTTPEKTLERQSQSRLPESLGHVGNHSMPLIVVELEGAKPSR